MERISESDIPQGLYQAMFQGQGYVEKSGLDKKLVHLIYFRVSLINSCAYCIDMHYKEAIHDGENPIRLISLQAWRETPYYSEKEKAVLEFAEHLTKLPADENSDNIHDELNKHFSKQEIANLTYAVIQINSWNRLVRSCGPIPGTYKLKESNGEVKEAANVLN